MPEDFGNGLYLALAGMGLVFLSLVLLMLILFALRKLFPSEEVKEIIEANDNPMTATITDENPVAAAINEAEVEPTIAEYVHVESQVQEAALSGPNDGRIHRAKVAAIAVALYLDMEQERDVAHPPVVPSAWPPTQDYSGWSILGRASIWGSQGRRPQAYNQRSQSAYPPRSRMRE
ncbi:hypothetical protein FIM08_01180 [SAR202 cluster bacterium AC-647-N09_OGT_505m]|nr:hypothetical protein [SAR202 cluster bacterium AC-647-N09_OGT_505m]